mmetsp:Transcript_85897/g.105383  ORF Transcript_85897/g.105383 Transcript_85897/m.105383 type:complete len:239 (+) Transcript_85897:481-1197(+)
MPLWHLSRSLALLGPFWCAPRGEHPVPLHFSNDHHPWEVAMVLPWVACPNQDHRFPEAVPRVDVDPRAASPASQASQASQRAVVEPREPRHHPTCQRHLVAQPVYLHRQQSRCSRTGSSEPVAHTGYFWHQRSQLPLQKWQRHKCAQANTASHAELCQTLPTGFPAISVEHSHLRCPTTKSEWPSVAEQRRRSNFCGAVRTTDALLQLLSRCAGSRVLQACRSRSAFQPEQCPSALAA